MAKDNPFDNWCSEQSLHNIGGPLLMVKTNLNIQYKTEYLLTFQSLPTYRNNS